MAISITKITGNNGKKFSKRKQDELAKKIFNFLKKEKSIKLAEIKSY